jgi:hypothetical protein
MVNRPNLGQAKVIKPRNEVAAFPEKSEKMSESTSVSLIQAVRQMPNLDPRTRPEKRSSTTSVISARHQPRRGGSLV